MEEKELQALLAQVQEAAKMAATQAYKEQLEAMQKQIEDLKKEANIETFKAEVTRIAAGFKALQEAPKTQKEASIADILKENKAKLKAIAKGGDGEITIKAVTNRDSIDGNAHAVDLDTIGQLATRRLSMYEAFPKVPVGDGNHNGTIRYVDWDEDTIVRAAAMRSEGAQFPESTAKFKTYTIALKKIGDTLPVTEEFMEDEVLAAGELELFLLTNVNLVVDDQISNGDGNGNNLKGLFASVPVFNPALVNKVEKATTYDLIAVAQEQITKTGGAKYQPTTVAMNISQINKMRLAKDKNENYIMPPFVDRSGRVIDGMRVVESNIVPNNQMVLGDFRFGRIYDKGTITIDRGYVDKQFIEDIETIKVRKRLAFLIRNADANGFVKITNVDAAVAAITAT